jgi:hypothetical protein
MKFGPSLAIASLAALLTTAAQAQLTVFVDDNFDSYGDQSAYEAAWPARAGDGFSAPPGPGGTLVLSGSGPAGQTGNAVSGPAGLVNEHAGGFDPVINPTGYLLQPSATQNIVVRGDIFADVTFATTMRQSIGLRSDRFDRNPDPAVTEFGVNLVEMGFWNGSVCLPTNPTCVIPVAGGPGDYNRDTRVDAADYTIWRDTLGTTVTAGAGADGNGNGVIDGPGAGSDYEFWTTNYGTPVDPAYRAETDFAFRLTLFDFTSLGNYFENGVDQGPMLAGPNWQYFPLDPALDAATSVKPNGTVGNGDGRTTLADIGSDWHTFEAVIGETSTTLTLDLYRDGINNATGLPGVDSTVVVEIAMAENFNNPPFKFDPAPMNSLRVGAPSGVTSDSGVATFDNLYLALDDVVAPASATIPEPASLLLVAIGVVAVAGRRV